MKKDVPQEDGEEPIIIEVIGLLELQNLSSLITSMKMRTKSQDIEQLLDSMLTITPSPGIIGIQTGRSPGICKNRTDC